jgi:hypothetical protein
MKCRELPHVDKYKEIAYDWNYDASYMLTSLVVLDLENYKCLIFVAQRVHITIFIQSVLRLISSSLLMDCCHV